MIDISFYAMVHFSSFEFISVKGISPGLCSGQSGRWGGPRTQLQLSSVIKPVPEHLLKSIQTITKPLQKAGNPPAGIVTLLISLLDVNSLGLPKLKTCLLPRAMRSRGFFRCFRPFSVKKPEIPALQTPFLLPGFGLFTESFIDKIRGPVKTVEF